MAANNRHCCMPFMRVMGDMGIKDLNVIREKKLINMKFQNIKHRKRSG